MPKDHQKSWESRQLVPEHVDAQKLWQNNTRWWSRGLKSLKPKNREDQKSWKNNLWYREGLKPKRSKDKWCYESLNLRRAACVILRQKKGSFRTRKSKKGITTVLKGRTAEIHDACCSHVMTRTSFEDACLRHQLWSFEASSSDPFSSSNRNTSPAIQTKILYVPHVFCHQIQHRWSVFSVRDVFLVKLWNLLGAWAVNRERAMSIISLQLFWSSAQECSDLLFLTSDSDSTMSSSSIPPVPPHYSNTWRKWNPPREEGEPFGCSNTQTCTLTGWSMSGNWDQKPSRHRPGGARKPKFCPGNHECELVKDDDGEEACCRCGVSGGRWAEGRTIDRP